MDFLTILKHFEGTIWDQQIKLVRHADGRFDLPWIEKCGLFHEYEERQGRPVFHKADVVLSFMGEGRTRARFLGASRVQGWTDKISPWTPGFPYPGMHPGRWRYQLAPIPEFSPMKDRLIIDWGSATRSWVQNLRPKEVVEIRPKGFVGDFPGYEDLLLDFDQLERVVANPDANLAWHRTLAAVAGVYLIVDTVTGSQYVGSAYGEGGLLARWSSYVRTLHGGNLKLKDLLAAHPGRNRSFQFAILRTLPKSMTAREVIEVECQQKRRLGTRAFGLNSN